MARAPRSEARTVRAVFLAAVVLVAAGCALHEPRRHLGASAPRGLGGNAVSADDEYDYAGTHVFSGQRHQQHDAAVGRLLGSGLPTLLFAAAADADAAAGAAPAGESEEQPAKNISAAIAAAIGTEAAAGASGAEEEPATCKSGFTGPLCAECAAGYVKNGGGDCVAKAAMAATPATPAASPGPASAAEPAASEATPVSPAAAPVPASAAEPAASEATPATSAASPVPASAAEPAAPEQPDAAAEAAVADAAELTPDVRRAFPYPELYRLGSIIEHWNPDDAEIPEDHGRYDSLRRLDFQDEEDLKEAFRLRDAELPFIARNIPAMERVKAKWTDAYLLEQFGEQLQDIEVSQSNHFMYYHLDRFETKAPPTTSSQVTYAQFIEHAAVDPPRALDEEHWYMKASAFPGRPGNQFILNDYEVFAPEPSLFLKDPLEYRGTHCRFGERGVIAESHYDQGRNMITMARGHKRYILQPPSECENLHMMTSGMSARHSAVDWSKPESRNVLWDDDHKNRADEDFYNAGSIDVLLTGGDALFVPAFWFHYPINLDNCIQCNARSGTPHDAGAQDIEDCGFATSHSEDASDAPATRAALLQELLDGTSTLRGPDGKWLTASSGFEHPATEIVDPAARMMAQLAAGDGEDAEPAVAAKAEKPAYPADPAAAPPAASMASEPRAAEPVEEPEAPPEAAAAGAEVDAAITAADVPDSLIPVHVNLPVDGGTPTMSMCPLNFERRAADPSTLGTFRSWVAESGCSTGTGTEIEMTFDQVRALLASDPDASKTEPDAFIFHQSRVGSTLVANMLSQRADTLIYPECQPLTDIIHSGASEEAMLDAVKLAVAAMGRPHGRKYLVYKMQSVMGFEMTFFLKAFPEAKFAFLYRDPVEILMSNMADAPTLDRYNVKQLGSFYTSMPPCLRYLEPLDSTMKALGYPQAEQIEAMSAMAYCMAHLAGLAQSALDVLTNEAEGGNCCNANGRGISINYRSLPTSVMTHMTPHFGMARETDAEHEKMVAQSKVYSKGYSSGHREFTGDSEMKQAAATDAAKLAANEYGFPFYNKLVELDPTKPPKAANFNVTEGAALLAVDPEWVPISVRETPNGEFEIMLCKLDFKQQAADPARLPLFKDVVAATNCYDPTKTMALEASELQHIVDADKDAPFREPTGMIFHESRCGSTLVANMFSSDENILSYAESAPYTDIVSMDIPKATAQSLIRTVTAAMGRPRGRKAMVFKMQSMLTGMMELFLEAFPSTPYVFVYRDPVEVTVSNLNDVGSGYGDASVADYVTHWGNVGPPCLRYYDPPYQETAELLGTSEPAQVVQRSVPELCMAHLSGLAKRAMKGMKGELSDGGCCGPARRGITINYMSLPQGVLDHVVPHFGIDLTEAEKARMLQVSKMYSKGRLQPFEFAGDAEEKHAASTHSMEVAAYNIGYPMYNRLTELDPSHPPQVNPPKPDDMNVVLLPPPADPSKAAADAAAAAAAAGMAPAPAPTPTPASEPTLTPSPVPVPQELPPAAVDNSVPPTRTTPAPTTSLRGSTASSNRDDDTGYPQLFPMGHVLSNWNPDEPERPDSYARYDSLRRLNFRDATDRAEALELRNAELPFIVYNVPDLDNVVDKWTDEYLLEQFGSAQHMVEESQNNHFMYVNRKAAANTPGYVPPVSDTWMSYADWLAKASAPHTASDPHYYFRASYTGGDDEFIHHDYTMFDPARSLGTGDADSNDAATTAAADGEEAERPEDFFVVDRTQQRGIHCRFGMAGINAGAHYDGGRNFVTMARGHKRYILSPPSECENLHILRDGPSARHSAVDWSNPMSPNAGFPDGLNTADDKFLGARVTDVVIGPGEALYIPSFYFHYPISLDTSIQCNSRSGTPVEGATFIEQCGFYVEVTEGAERRRPLITGKRPGWEPRAYNPGRYGYSLFDDPIWIAVAVLGAIVTMISAYRVFHFCRFNRGRRKLHYGL